MVQRQPGRPTEQAFIGAAIRFGNGNYVREVRTIGSGAWTTAYVSDGGKERDIAIIRSEMEAEGRNGEPETLEAFAVRQLSRYQKLRRG